MSWFDGDKNKKNRRWTVGRNKWDVEKITHTHAEITPCTWRPVSKTVISVVFSVAVVHNSWSNHPHPVRPHCAQRDGVASGRECCVPVTGLAVGRSVGRRSAVCLSCPSAGRSVGRRDGQSSLNDAPPAARIPTRGLRVDGAGRPVLGIGGGAGRPFRPPRRGHTVKARAGAHVLRRDRGRWPETFWFGGPRTVRPPARPPANRSRPSPPRVAGAFAHKTYFFIFFFSNNGLQTTAAVANPLHRNVQGRPAKRLRDAKSDDDGSARWAMSPAVVCPSRFRRPKHKTAVDEDLPRPPQPTCLPVSYSSNLITTTVVSS
ncbi:Uncharacterized protein FWK35_00006803 [Aphis craccivora]|uniref:Uncharacterized protein n=1 Tax=Aphis craccivora TaxID=307492 RepID=A0A6G0ZIX5_APHCR|nr:Uncharacterized protein FWK35_00006803 [Aphis craccivora]